MDALKNRRWFNPSLPQMLQIATFLLYFGAFFGLLDLFDALDSAPLLPLLVVVASVPLHVLGGLGVSEERKRGYQLAVAASFVPFAYRLTLLLTAVFDGFGPGMGTSIKFVIMGDSLLTFIFEAALVGLLLHPQSKEHQRIWFH